MIERVGGSVTGSLSSFCSSILRIEGLSNGWTDTSKSKVGSARVRRNKYGVDGGSSLKEVEGDEGGEASWIRMAGRASCRVDLVEEAGFPFPLMKK